MVATLANIHRDPKKPAMELNQFMLWGRPADASEDIQQAFETLSRVAGPRDERRRPLWKRKGD